MMKKTDNHLFELIIFFLFLASSILFTPVHAAESKPILEIKNGLIDLSAENVNFKTILKSLEENSSVCVTIFDGVPDKKVSVNINALPIYCLSTLLQKMGLDTSAVIYNADTGKIGIYVLPKGHDIAEVIKGKSVIRQVNFSNGQNVDFVKGKSIESIQKGLNNLPIRYVKNELLLKFHLGVTEQDIEDILKKHNLIRVDNGSLSKIGYIKAEIPDSRTIKEVKKAIGNEYQVKISEPNYILNVLTSPDPLSKNQWYIQETHFDQAWEQIKNKSSVKVAVIDSGVDGNHLDLAGKILTGYDFVNDKEEVTDDNGHGTFVTGIIAAASNNIGIKGLYDFARIIPVKVIDENGLGTYEDVAKGIIFAADSGARVINLSIGGYGFSFMLQDAIDYTLEKGCIVLAAGGNDGIKQAIHPAAYPDVIGVSALDSSGKIWSHSNSGNHIDVCAPGVNILSTGLDGSYYYASGTSASTPMVSALAAMLVSEMPELSNSVIEKLIIQSAKDLGDKGWDKIYGNGEVDALAVFEQEVESFHDVAVRGTHIEPHVFQKDEPTDIVPNIENNGTFKPEKFDIVKGEDNSNTRIVSTFQHNDIVIYGDPNADEGITRKKSHFPTNPDLYTPIPIPEHEEFDRPTRPENKPVSFNLITGEESIHDSPSTMINLPNSDYVKGSSGINIEMRKLLNLLGDIEEISQLNFSDLTKVSNPDNDPWPVICKLYIQSGFDYYSGSGVLIDPMHVITAGHCVNNEDYGGWADQIVILPAFNGSFDPLPTYGKAMSVELHSWSGWTNDGDHDDDIGVIDLDRPIGALTGWHSYGYNNDPDFYTGNTFHCAGYPGEDPYDGMYMYYWYGNFDGTDSTLGVWWGNTVRINRIAYSGQSGSGAYYNYGGDRTVYAILSNTNTYLGRTYCPRITSDKFFDIRDIIANDTPSTFDLIPLSVNVSPAIITAGDRLSSMSYLVHNYSSAGMSGTIDVDVYLSSNDNITTSDTLIQTHSVITSINSKSSTTVTVSTPPTIPASISPGNYYIGVILDSADANTSNNDSDGQDASPITITFTPTRIISLGGDLAFGNLTVGSSAQRTLTIYNNGNSTLTVSSISYPSGFSGSWSGSISAGSSRNVTVTFAPTSEISYGGTITVNSNRTSGTNTRSCSGTGVATPTCTYSLPVTSSSAGASGGTSIVNVYTQSGCNWNAFSNDAWITITSGSTGSGNGAVSYSISANSNTSSRSGTMTIAGITFTVNQSGAAPTRIISLSGDMAFGNVTVGDTAQRTLMISNTGNSTLTVSSINYPSGFNGSWSGTISAGSSRNVTVTFAPNSATSYGGTITVNSDKTSGTNTRSCSGTGVATSTRIISLSGNLAFGNVQVGSTAQRTLTISNTGNSTLSVSSISYPSGFSGSWSGTISAGSSRNVTVTFAPNSATSYGGTIAVNSDKTSGTNTRSCSGTGKEDGNGKCGIGLYNPEDARFFIKNDLSGGVADTKFYYGPSNAGWDVITGDWNGNGQTTVGLYNPDQSKFYLKNTHSGGAADIKFCYGPAFMNWIPITGDWNGNGHCGIGLYNPEDARFFIKNSLSGGVADTKFYYGPSNAGWDVITGDWDGDGDDTIGLYSSQNGTFYLKNTFSGGSADVKIAFGPRWSNWEPVCGDWDGDGIDEIGLFNPINSTFYLKNTHSGGTADIKFDYGPAGSQDGFRFLETGNRE